MLKARRAIQVSHDGIQAITYEPGDVVILPPQLAHLRQDMIDLGQVEDTEAPPEASEDDDADPPESNELEAARAEYLVKAGTPANPRWALKTILKKLEEL